MTTLSFIGLLLVTFIIPSAWAWGRDSEASKEAYAVMKQQS